MPNIGRYSMIQFLYKLFSKVPEPSKPQEPPHVHSFELIAKTIAEPTNPSICTMEAHHQCGALIPQSAYLGVTSYLWECTECGYLRKEELLGSEEPALSTILAKVDEQGLIKIVRGGKTYLVGPLEEPRQPGTLPVR